MILLVNEEPLRVERVNLVDIREMLVVLCIWVHDGAVCLEVSGLTYTCTGSCRSSSLSGTAIWNHIGKILDWNLLFL